MLGKANAMIKQYSASPIILPSEYQRVQSLYSTNTTWAKGPVIDTLVQPTNTTKIEMLYSFASISSPQGWGKLLVAYSSDNDIFGLQRSNETNDLQIFVMGNDGTQYTGLEDGLITGVHYIMVDLMNGIYIDGEGRGGNISEVNIPSDAPTMTIFRAHSGSDYHSQNEMRLYDLKIYEADMLIRHFVPCYQKSNNTKGLYDIVNNVFYTNVSSGTFSVEQDVYYEGLIY